MLLKQVVVQQVHVLVAILCITTCSFAYSFSFSNSNSHKHASAPVLSSHIANKRTFASASTSRQSFVNRQTRFRLAAAAKTKQKIDALSESSKPPSPPTAPPALHSCQFCTETFISRNALFRHLRNSEACARMKAAKENNGDFDYSPYVLQRNDVILSIAYDSFCPSGSISASTSASIDMGNIDKTVRVVEVIEKMRSDSSDSDPKIIGETIKESFQYALNILYNQTVCATSGSGTDSDSSAKENKDLIPKIMRSTQTSIASQRHSSLCQENSVGSCGGEVMSLSYLYPVRRTLSSEKKEFRESEKDRVLGELLVNVQDYLENKSIHVHVHDTCKSSDLDNDIAGAGAGGTRSMRTPSSIISGIELLSAKNLSSDAKLHAEMSCTQRVYHYLLPLRWIDGGKDVETWWLDNRDEMLKEGHVQIHGRTKSREEFGQGGEMRARISPPNDALRNLKEALRSMECKRISKRAKEEEYNGPDSNLAAGRYGVLGMKLRRPFHNFADPMLKGDASPSNKPVWRVVDRCRIAEFVPFEIGHDDNNNSNSNENSADGNKHETQVMVVIEFRGDDFILQQARRIIGSAVAIANGWLQPDFVETATRSDVVIETPLAPDNRLYFADARFHFDELMQGKRLFDDVDLVTVANDDDSTFETNNPSNRRQNAMVTIQNKITQRSSAECIQQEEKLWLSKLKHETCPKISEQLQKMNDAVYAIGTSSTGNNNEPKEVPSAYNDSLALLRNIIAAGNWPSTSVARSKVIKKDGAMTEEKDVIESGSFTIINPKFQDGALMNNPKVRIPRGNAKFPELVDAIFNLELNLSNDPESGVFGRPPSSHCAVNRNAQFTPHVDSGRGAGQSLSMICGLGGYNGGQLMIEGDPAEIQYKAKEFDGWKERHWTAPFNGERYSLVWFTPEM